MPRSFKDISNSFNWLLGSVCGMRGAGHRARGLIQDQYELKHFETTEALHIYDNLHSAALDFDRSQQILETAMRDVNKWKVDNEAYLRKNRKTLR